MQERVRRDKAAAAYIRVASQHPEDAGAVQHQRAGCDRIAAKRGLTIVREYVDQGCPAELERQQHLLQLLRDLGRDQDVASVVIWDYSRLASDLEQLQAIIDWIRNCGAEVITMTGVEAASRFITEHDQEYMNERERRTHK
ncbi:recombinase family protein [Amycolatopsis sp.]|uniref:recombinase family protein n=1 Tax=Amycolatopsis sp. TaxID=37632 RepID=UPI002CA25418|nr:recombinase family protein [Amycolatopsis sp.]HVV12453.1 recombinase family protein [Amycolatopsis sp.]